MLEPLFNKFASLKAYNVIEKELQDGCFPANIAKFLRISILKNICKQLLSVTSEQWPKQTKKSPLTSSFFDIFVE